MRKTDFFLARKLTVVAVIALLLSSASPAWAQELNKLSISTQMFLDEQEGRISFDTPAQITKAPSLAAPNTPLRIAKWDRPIVSPVNKAGRDYISAFVRVTDRSAVSELESLGVEIQCEFSNGTLYTTLIPIDKIRSVAKVARVTHIDVAKKLRPMTNAARQGTNVDDVLTYSASARAAGLPNAYDGTGVLVGVIDTGIDFQHKAFKDKNGNSRIKRAYVVSTSGYSYSAKEYGDGLSNAITTSQPTTDDDEEDHGTHTSSTAGGSSVVLNGSTTTVTDDHANATYGGMAPGASLYLAGCDLSETYVANSFQKICNYADSKGLPVVVSNSWGSQVGPHDGTGTMAEIINQYFGDTHPNHICLFASSNDAGTNGFHLSGNATSSQPLGTVMNYNTEYGLSYYYGILANAWSRATGVSLRCRLIVLKSDGSKVTEVDVNPTQTGTSATSVSGLSRYASGTLYAYRNYVSSEKSQIMLYTQGLQLNSGYKLAVQFYPASGSTVVDIWSGAAYTYYTSTPSTSGYTWTRGTDDMTVSDESTYVNGIPIGAYSTKSHVTDYQNTSHNLGYTEGEIAYFSSYATADQSPTGLAYPWICAPGATVVSAVNHYDTSGDYSYLNGNSDEHGFYRVNTDKSNPYGSMEGTSMATPVAAGIVALWLQAAQSVGKQLTVNDVKEIMRETAISDSYTTGARRTHFGNGKIDALAGIRYILGEVVDKPRINVTSDALDFGEVPAGTTAVQTITVTGVNLEGDIELALDGTENFTLSKTTVGQAAAEGEGATVTVAFKPTAKIAATYNATITLTTEGANTITVALTGKGAYVPPALTATPQQVSFDPVTVGGSATQTFTLAGTNLVDNVTLTLNDEAGVFALSDMAVSQADAAAGKGVAVTFAPMANETYTATVQLATTDGQPITVTLTGTGSHNAPAMLSADPARVKHTAFRADWNDDTPDANIDSYTLEVTYVPPLQLLEEADFSSLEAYSSWFSGLRDASSRYSTYLPSGWTCTSPLYIDDGLVIVGKTVVTKTYSLPTGFDKISVVVSAKRSSKSSRNRTVSLQVSTSGSGQSQTQNMDTNEAEYTYVLPATSNEKITFTGTNYPGMTSVKVYAGDVTQAGSRRLIAASETGDSLSRLITGITDKYYTVNGLTAGGTFTYRVKALYTNASESLWSNAEQVTLAQEPDAPEYLQGDVNGDDVVDINDVNILLNIILGYDNADNYDGRAYILGNSTIDVADVNTLINIILTE